MSDLRQLDEIETELVDRAAAGQIIKDATTRVGFQLLFTKAKESAIKARNALVAADPDNPKEIRQLQNDVKRYEEMADWIRTAIVDGETAFQQLEAHRGEVPAGGASDAGD